MNTIIESLNLVKKLLRAFEWKLADKKSDVVLVVEEISKIRQEIIEPLTDTSQVLEKVNSELTLWISQALQMLFSEERLDAIHASLIFSNIREPSYNLIIAKIDTYIYQQTGDLGTFIQR